MSQTTGVAWTTYPEVPDEKWDRRSYAWPWGFRETVAHFHERTKTKTWCRWVTPTHLIEETTPGVHRHLIIHNPQEALPDL